MMMEELLASGGGRLIDMHSPNGAVDIDFTLRRRGERVFQRGGSDVPFVLERLRAAELALEQGIQLRK